MKQKHDVSLSPEEIRVIENLIIRASIAYARGARDAKDFKLTKEEKTTLSNVAARRGEKDATALRVLRSFGVEI